MVIQTTILNWVVVYFFILKMYEKPPASAALFVLFIQWKKLLNLTPKFLKMTKCA
jgi:hypothetical protein